MSNHPTTAVFGFYGVGNYGDDLMAWMIADHLRSIGRRAVIHSVADGPADSLQGEDFSRRGFEASSSIEATLSRCDSVIYGGGGLLVSHAGTRLRRFARFFRRERAFLEAVRRRGLPLAVLSVGGDGGEDPRLLDPFAVDLLRYAESVTVRNRSDLTVLERLGVAGHFHPDIVWGASRLFPGERRRRERIRVGLDLYPSMMWRRGGLRMLMLTQAIILANPAVRFVCLDSTHVSRGRSGGIGRLLRGRNVERYRFREFPSDLDEIRSLDLLLSSRLHVPMVALQYGVPVMSVLSEAKTWECMEAIGLRAACFGPDRLRELEAVLRDWARMEEWIRAYRFPGCSRLAGDASGHFRAIDAFLQGK